jgi:hypothetical protein
VNRHQGCDGLTAHSRAAACSPVPLIVAVGQGKTRAIPFKPSGSVRVVEVRAPPLLGRPHPTTRAFQIFGRAAYFFLAARPRPAGAARNEMPVRIAFC